MVDVGNSSSDNYEVVTRIIFRYICFQQRPQTGCKLTWQKMGIGLKEGSVEMQVTARYLLTPGVPKFFSCSAIYLFDIAATQAVHASDKVDPIFVQV